jgi:hypothetical protein
MATITDDTTGPRFSLSIPFVLVYLRAWFSGGTGDADLAFKQWILSESSGFFNATIREFPDVGTGGDDFVDFRIQSDEYQHWCWAGGDALVPIWTNPNTQRWILEVGLAPYPT